MSMKLNKATAIALLVELGFPNAETWDDDKIKDKLSKVPGRLTADAVTGEFVETFNELVKAKGVVELAATEKGKDAEESGDEKKPEGKKATAKPAAKSDKKPAAKGKKVAADKPAKAPKKAKEPKAEAEKDDYGATVGTVRAKVNKTFSTKWKTDAEAGEEAGVTARQAKIGMRKAVKAGILEKRRRVEYRLVPAGGAKAAKK